MKTNDSKTERRDFLKKSTRVATSLTMLSAGLVTNEVIAAPVKRARSAQDRIRVALVGTGIRGSHTWGKDLLKQLSDKVEMVGLCDINAKRVEVAKEFIGIKAKTYADSEFGLMLKETRPDAVIKAGPSKI